jgi:tetratricopeptide (TPR) repeat protein
MRELEKLTPEKASGIKFSSDAQIERATALHHLGLVGDARSLLTQYTRPAHLAPRRAVLQMLLGREIEAAQTLLAMPEDSFERVSVLWHGLCALLGRNDAALERLRRDPKDNPLSLGLFLRALAVRGEFKDTDAIVSAQAAMNGWPPWFQNRIHADLRLDSGSSESEILEEARKRLNRLANTGGMPPIHLADVLFNLAVAWDWIGHSKNAKAAYKGALQLNPHLEPAKERLEALG